MQHIFPIFGLQNPVFGSGSVSGSALTQVRIHNTELKTAGIGSGNPGSSIQHAVSCVSGVAAAGLPGDPLPVCAVGGGGATQGPDEGQDQGLPLRSACSGTGPYKQPV